jgi:hypothetical protein
VEAVVGAVAVGELGLGAGVSGVRGHEQLRELVEEVCVVGDVGPHDAPAVPQEQLVIHPVGELRDDVRSHEPLPAHRHVRIDTVRLDVDASRAVVAPDLCRGRERRPRSNGHGERVERQVAGTQLGIEAHPAAAEMRLDDHVVVVPVRAEVGREPDAAPCRDPVLAKRADAEQRVVAAAALDTPRERPLRGERPGVPALVHVEDPVEPAQVDVGAGLGRQLRLVRPIVRDHVARHGAKPGGVDGERLEERGAGPRVAVRAVGGVVQRRS